MVIVKQSISFSIHIVYNGKSKWENKLRILTCLIKTFKQSITRKPWLLRSFEDFSLENDRCNRYMFGRGVWERPIKLMNNGFGGNHLWNQYYFAHYQKQSTRVTEFMIAVSYRYLLALQCSTHSNEQFQHFSMACRISVLNLCAAWARSYHDVESKKAHARTHTHTLHVNIVAVDLNRSPL
jgi:hypothetical protein